MDAPDRSHHPPAPEPAPPAEQLEIAPGTLALLGDVAFGAPLVPALLDAYLKDRGHDPARRWKLKLLGAVIVSDDGGSSETSGPVGAGRHTGTETEEGDKKRRG
jgi:hypothetical protein